MLKQQLTHHQQSTAALIFFWWNTFHFKAWWFTKVIYKGMSSWEHGGLGSWSNKDAKGVVKRTAKRNLWCVCCLLNLSRCLHHRSKHEHFVLVGPTGRMRDIWFDQWGVKKFALVTALCLCITCNHGGTTEGADIEVESFWNRHRWLKG